MPRLWDETIEAHRRAVQGAALDATATLVAEHGPMSVTMSRIARETGIGRATLYKYFSDVEEILLAWHERHVDAHLKRLAAARDEAGDAGDAGERLEAVLGAYALISREHHGVEPGAHLAELLHRGGHVGRAQRRLVDFIGGLLVEAQQTGDVRDDVAPEELSAYCIHALAAARSLSSEAATRRLVVVILAGLRPPPRAVRHSGGRLE
jgi:AcrR family transcriptional regulator